MTEEQKRHRLIELMEASNTGCEEVARILNRKVTTIYAWRSRSDSRYIPDHALELLEFKLGASE